MNRKIVYPLLIILVTAALYYGEKYIDRQNEAYPEIVDDRGHYETFDDSYLPTSTTGVVVPHAAFTLSYSEEHEQAEWVAYELKKSQLSKNEFERPYFVQDRSVPSGSADWRNYKNSGYDRGHLCAAADRKFDYEVFHQTFFTSNISPQDHNFNAGIWNRLEQKVRYWAGRRDGVYVITGGVLTDGLKTIGEEEVSVPEMFYKIVLDRDQRNHEAIAFLIPNRATDKSFYEFAVPIDFIEEKTGINFFPLLSRVEQNRLESTVRLKEWGGK